MMDDLISRQAAIDALGEKPFAWGEYELGLQNQWEHDVDAIKALRPVTPKTECSCEQIKWERDMAIAQLNELGYGLGEKPRTGHWIRLKHGKGKCSECHDVVLIAQMYGNANYCPNCGKRMIEPQESEDKG